jgi:hypothetical protein
MVPEAGHRLTRFDLPPAYAGQSREGYWLAQGAVPINLKDPVEEVRLPQRIHVGNLLSTREENRGCTPREAPELSRASKVKVFAGQSDLIAIATRVAGTLFHAKLVLAPEATPQLARR